MTAATGVTHSRSKWDTFLFEAESPSPMALVRIAWGAVAAVWALTWLPDIDPFLTDGALRYDRPRGESSWNLLDHFHGSGPPIAVCLLLIVTGITTCVGYRTRLSSVLAALAMLSLQRTNPTVLNSGDLLLRQIGIFVALAPSGVLLSVDAVRLRRRSDASGPSSPPRRAPWALRALQLNLAFGYLLSAWAKLQGPTWHDGTAVTRALRIEDLQRLTVPDWLLQQDILFNLITWGTLAFEAAFFFVVWKRRWRPWVLGLGVAFHLGIDLTFDVGFFSIAILVAYLGFVPPEVADRWAAKIRGWMPARLTS